MKRNKPSIDITQTVMQRIERDGVRMRSKQYFAVRSLLKKFLLFVGLGISILGFMSLGYVFKNDIFIDYKNLASQGEFIASLPWPGILLTTLSVVTVVLMFMAMRRQSTNFRLGYAMAAWLIVIVGAIGIAGSLNSNHTPSVLARTAFWSDKDPSKLYGEVIEIVDGDSLKVKVGDEILIVYTNTDGVKTGDKVLILGKQKDGKVYVNVLRITEKAPEKTTEKKVTKKKTENKPKPEEPKPEPEPEPTVTASTPTAEPKPIPKPTTQPAPTPTKTIAITGIYPDDPDNPTKFKIYFESNFATATGWKSPYVAYDGTPVYPGNSYCEYTYEPDSISGRAICYKSSLSANPGDKFNVRICAYNNGTCEVYSPIITIEF